jgi:hypothetical protein
VIQKNNSLQKNHEPFWFLFLAGIYTLITFSIFLNFQATNIKTKSDDFNFYILGWVFFVPLGLGIAALVEKFHADFLKNFPLFSFVMVFFNFYFLLYLLYPVTLRFSSGSTELVEFLLLQFCIVLIVKSLQVARQPISAFLEKSLMILMSFSFVVWVLSLAPPSFKFFKNGSAFNWLFSCFVVLFIYVALSYKTKEVQKFVLIKGRDYFFKREPFYYFIALFLIVILVIDPDFGFNRYHYSFFLGPLADFQSGKSFLVNINSQYGIFIFYFLSIFFKVLPLGFESFCFVLTFLFVFQYFCFYFILRQLFSSRLFSFICLVVLLMINYFATMGRITESPSVGPLRFGFIYLLLALVILRNQHPSYKRYFYIFESAVVAVAVFWSFEVCVYTLPPYLGLMFYESIRFEPNLKINWKSFNQRIVGLIFFCLLFLSFIYGDVYRRTYELPHWSYYFDYVFLYKNGFGMFFVPALGGWWVIACILLGSFLIVWGSLTKWKHKILPTHLNAMAFLTFYGIFQFFYFLGRAHPNNLFHISMPSILLSAYWLYWLGKIRDESVIPSTMKKSIFVLSALGLIIYLPFLVPDAGIKLSQSLKLLPSFPQNVWAASKDLPRDDQFAKTADLLMNRYSGSKKELIYLLGDKDLEVSMYTGRINTFPYNDIAQVSICPPTLQRVVFYQPSISIGDYIYTSREMDRSYYDMDDGGTHLSYFEKIIFYQLNQSFNLKLIEQQKGISVYQVMGSKSTFS